MRKHGRTDANQAEVVDALRKAGCAVFITSAVGQGFPDLAVSRITAKGAETWLMEVKRGPNEKLTLDQETFRTIWRGNWARVNNSIEALEVVGVL